MAKEEIVEKLKTFLERHDPLTEECHVVYLLVEARKVLDRENNLNYPILRFYCNWVVHTNKDSTKEMEIIMEEIHQDVKRQISNPALIRGRTKVSSFMYMEDLKNEFESFLDEYELPMMIIERASWIELVKLLVRVLVDQPIERLQGNITRFAFLPAAERCVRGRIDFKKNIGEYDHYLFGNAY